MCDMYDQMDTFWPEVVVVVVGKSLSDYTNVYAE